MKIKRFCLAAIFTCLFTATAYASTDNEIRIHTACELAAISMDKSYILAADLTLPHGWTPIGCESSPFTGSFDGGGHTIADLSQSLFGNINGASISNLVLQDANISIPTAYDVQVVGILANYARDSIVTNITIKNSQISAPDNAISGGLIGYIEGTGYIKDCHAHANITGGIAGGLIGHAAGNPLSANANHQLEILDSTATGNIVASGIAGGFIGQGAYVQIKDCFAYGHVEAQMGAGGFVGLLSGRSRIIYAYAKGDVVLKGETGFAGGFIGKLTGSACVEFSYTVGSVLGLHSGDASAIGGFVGIITSDGAPNTITHSLSFAPWVVGNGYVHRFAGRVYHDGVNGCYAHLGSMVVRDGVIICVLPSAFGPDGADMSMVQVENVTERLGWRRGVNV